MGSVPVDGRTALIVVVPEAQLVVGALRAAHDPSARAGVPAHVTILVPFVPADAWETTTDERLAALAARHDAFDAQFARTARFGTTTLYLVPEPARPFEALTRAVTAEFPAYPPYGGAHDQIVPHLTVADGCGRKALDAAEAALRGAPTVRTRVRELTLIEQRAALWHVRARWPLR